MLHHLFRNAFFIKLNPTVVDLALFKLRMWLYRYAQQNSKEIPGHFDNQDACLYSHSSGAHTFGPRYTSVAFVI